jgi:penicillin-binding protein 2
LASRPIPLRPGRFLPPDPRVEAPYRLTAQMVFRIGILGFLVLAAFGVLFFRLWALQVLSGTQYLQAAENNQLRTLRVEAKRGPIVDRFGRAIVQNRAGTAVRIWPADLPKKGAYAELKRLSGILEVPLSDVTAQIKKHRGDPLAPVTVKEDITNSEALYLMERQSEFPGLELPYVYLRTYPYGDLAAQLLGHIGEISPEELKERHGYRAGDRIGQGGIEASYDKFLRGKPGESQLRVDALGRPTSAIVPNNVPLNGYQVRLTLDAKLQRATQGALAFGIELAQKNDNWAADAGAIVALDPRDGAIRALASFPTYRPDVFVGRAKKDALEPLLDQHAAEEANYPALNRATAGLYPPGSTFKPVTALAAMQEHILAPYDTLPCTGKVTIAKQVFRNWNPYANESMNLRTALAESCDTYFYEVGKRFYDLPADRGQPLQRWARTFGFGESTGIDVGPEEPGLVPTIKWRRQTYRAEIDRIWKPGDSVQLAIGQKDIQVTPLQMARFYALLANGGKLVTPHLVSSIEQTQQKGSPTGPLVLRRFSRPVTELNVDPGALSVVRDGLYEATHAASGTSSGVFGHYPIGIAGKTGTAERVVDLGNGWMPTFDTSWWCGWGPFAPSATLEPLVVCAMIENGGFGGEAAAPAALKVFETHFGKKAGFVQAEQAD